MSSAAAARNDKKEAAECLNLMRSFAKVTTDTSKSATEIVTAACDANQNLALRLAAMVQSAEVTGLLDGSLMAKYESMLQEQAEAKAEPKDRKKLPYAAS
jgi:hypothetical protein